MDQILHCFNISCSNEQCPPVWASCTSAKPYKKRKVASSKSTTEFSMPPCESHPQWRHFSGCNSTLTALEELVGAQRSLPAHPTGWGSRTGLPGCSKMSHFFFWIGGSCRLGIGAEERRATFGEQPGSAGEENRQLTHSAAEVQES